MLIFHAKSVSVHTIRCPHSIQQTNRPGVAETCLSSESTMVIGHPTRTMKDDLVTDIERFLSERETTWYAARGQ